MFQPESRAQRRHLEGKRIIIQPDNLDVLAKPDNPRAHTDFRACGLTCAKDSPTGRANSYYRIFYVEIQLIVTANLASVQHDGINGESDAVSEVRNAEIPLVHLDEPAAKR